MAPRKDALGEGRYGMTRNRGWMPGIFLATGLLPAAPCSADDGVLAPNENLVAEGIPSIPASIRDRAFPYAESRSASVEGWNPKRREMLIATRFGDTRQLHLVRMPMGARKQITFFPEQIGGA